MCCTITIPGWIDDCCWWKRDMCRLRIITPYLSLIQLTYQQVQSCKHTGCLSEDGRSGGWVDVSSHALSHLSLICLFHKSLTKSVRILNYSHGEQRRQLVGYLCFTWNCSPTQDMITIKKHYQYSVSLRKRPCLYHHLHDEVMSIKEERARQKFCGCTKEIWGARRQIGLI